MSADSGDADSGDADSGDDPPTSDSVSRGAGFSTEDGGQASDSVDNQRDPVKAALAGAQRLVRTRPSRRRPPRAKAGGEQAGGAHGGYSGAWPDGTDPAPVGDVVGGYLADRGWERPLAEARVFTDWAAIVGADIASHCSPTALHEGELRLSAESTAWATQLRLLGARLLARIVAELGPDIVTRVSVTGPVAPSWRHGSRAVRGGRGPRDTYG